MDAIEAAIRRALEKGDASDRAFREKVYRSIFSALNKASSENPDLSPEAAGKRRQALAAKVREIESAYIRAAHNIADPVIEPEPAFDHGTVEVSEEISDDGNLDAVTPFEREVSERINAEPELQVDEGTEPPPVFSQKKRPFAWMLSACIAVAGIGIAIWWVYQSELFVPIAQRDNSVPNPPRSLDAEDYQPASGESPALSEEAEVQRSWISIFTPDDPGSAVATSGANVEVVGEGDEKALRIQSSAEDSAVMFDVGEGVLEQIAGGKAVFNIVAASEEGKPTEFSIRCNFGNMGNCVRRRFSANPTIADYLFEVDLPDEAPGAAGTIALISDVSGTGAALDIREIKVSVSR